MENQDIPLISSSQKMEIKDCLPSLSFLKEQYKLAKEREEKAKKLCTSLEEAIYSLERVFDHPNGYESILRVNTYAEMTTVEAVCKILSLRGELKTKEIIEILEGAGKRWKSKNPPNSLYATLHKTMKYNKKGIIRTGSGKWGLKK
jgi:hypothetical protein